MMQLTGNDQLLIHKAGKRLHSVLLHDNRESCFVIGGNQSHVLCSTTHVIGLCMSTG